jgi:hypothetical protein
MGHASQGQVSGLEFLLILPFQDPGQRIGGGFRPTQPGFAHFHGIKDIPGVGNAGNMIPVLMGHHQGLESPLRLSLNVFGYLTDYLLAAGGAA